MKLGIGGHTSISYTINHYCAIEKNGKIMKGKKIYEYDKIKSIVIDTTLFVDKFFPNLVEIKAYYPFNIDFIKKHNFIKKLQLKLFDGITQNDFMFLMDLNLDSIEISGNLPKDFYLPKYIRFQTYSCNLLGPCNGVEKNIQNIYYEQSFLKTSFLVYNIMNEYSGEYIDVIVKPCHHRKIGWLF